MIRQEETPVRTEIVEDNDNNDTGQEYGDVNDVSREGEELLETIDLNALKIFPILFLGFNAGYWCHYMLVMPSC